MKACVRGVSAGVGFIGREGISFIDPSAIL